MHVILRQAVVYRFPWQPRSIQRVGDQCLCSPRETATVSAKENDPREGSGQRRGWTGRRRVGGSISLSPHGTRQCRRSHVVAARGPARLLVNYNYFCLSQIQTKTNYTSFRFLFRLPKMEQLIVSCDLPGQGRYFSVFGGFYSIFTYLVLITNQLK